MQKLNPCAHCGAEGAIYPSGSGLYYARCTKCDKYFPYDFLGRTAKLAAEQWNAINTTVRQNFHERCREASAKVTPYEYVVNGVTYPMLNQAAAIAGVRSSAITGAFNRNGIAVGTVRVGGVNIQRVFKNNKTTKE